MSDIIAEVAQVYGRAAHEITIMIGQNELQHDDTLQQIFNNSPHWDDRKKYLQG